MTPGELILRLLTAGSTEFVKTPEAAECLAHACREIRDAVNRLSRKEPE